MTTPQRPPVTSRLRRFAPALACLAVLALLVAGDWPARSAATSPFGLDGTTPSAQPGVVASGSAGPSGPSATDGAQPTHVDGLDGASPGVVGGTGTPGQRPQAPGPDCRPDGRLPGVSVYMPPCVPVFHGPNGGSTARGVSKDTIIVARMIGQTDPASSALLSGFGDAANPANVDRAQKVLRRYFNLHYETYGREVVFVDVTQSGTDEQAARADAERVIKEIGAFVVIPGPAAALHPAFTEELAARGGVCVNCNVWPLWQSFYRRNAGKAFLALGPTIEQHYAQLAEYQAKRLAGRKARWAGDTALQTQVRKFGLIWLDGDNNGPNPESKTSRDFYVALLKQYGITLAAETSYVYDLSRTQEQATTAIVKMHNAGVTTVVCMCESITPIFFTNTATSQKYYPEWINPGLRQMDLTTIARRYDQTQWRHSFGIDPLPTPYANPALSEVFRAYLHVQPGAKPGDESPEGLNIFPTFDILWTGITMAGPHLTAETFARGLFNYPATGGTPKASLARYTVDNPSHATDFAEFFWDADVTGKDETGTEGQGAYRRVDGGRRYQLGQWPVAEPRVFVLAGSVVADNTLPGPVHEQDGHRHPASQRCRSCS